jgi:hypothetical protein
MRGKLRLLAVACAIALPVLATAPGAQAASPVGAILKECTSGQLSHSYTLAQLRKALAQMSASEKQYTSCVDVITQGILTVKAGKTTGPKGGGGSFLPTPVIIILVVLILAGVTFGALAIRQRRAGSGGPGSPDDAPGPPDGGSPPGGDAPAT